MNNNTHFENLVKDVWNQVSLEDKKEAALYLISEMKYKKEAGKLTIEVNKAKIPTQVDFIVSNLTLSGEGTKVI